MDEALFLRILRVARAPGSEIEYWEYSRPVRRIWADAPHSRMRFRGTSGLISRDLFNRMDRDSRSRGLSRESAGVRSREVSR